MKIMQIPKLNEEGLKFWIDCVTSKEIELANFLPAQAKKDSLRNCSKCLKNSNIKTSQTLPRIPEEGTLPTYSIRQCCPFTKARQKHQNILLTSSLY